MRVLSALALLPLAACSEPPPPPNVVVVSIDMLRADHVSCYGYGRRTTPTIDALAAEGVRFANHFTSAPWTLPAHTALFTSLADSVHGVTDGARTALAPEFTTLAERFRSAGYRTGGFYAGPYLHAAFGLGQGFERYEYAVDYDADFPAADAQSWGGDPAAMRRTHHGVTNPGVYAAAERWLAEHHEEPFFLFVHFWDAHYDFVPPPPFDRSFTDPRYDGFVTGREFFFDPRIQAGMDAADLAQLVGLYDGEILWTDAHVKKLLDELERLGHAEDTLVVVTSDHGTELFDHGQKGHRRTLYDEALSVPLVMRGPGVAVGRAVSEQTRIVDVGPTLLELCGLAPAADVMGHSLVGLMRGEALDFDNAAMSELLTDGVELRSLRTGAGKFVQNGETVRVWYDLERDPGERTPQRDAASGAGAELAAAMDAARAELAARVERRPAPPVAPGALPAQTQASIDASGYGGASDDD
jgi:arylsulfatase A-like enzyme